MSKAAPVQVDVQEEVEAKRKPRIVRIKRPREEQPLEHFYVDTSRRPSKRSVLQDLRELNLNAAQKPVLDDDSKQAEVKSPSRTFYRLVRSVSTEASQPRPAIKTSELTFKAVRNAKRTAQQEKGASARYALVERRRQRQAQEVPAAPRPALPNRQPAGPPMAKRSNPEDVMGPEDKVYDSMLLEYLSQGAEEYVFDEYEVDENIPTEVQTAAVDMTEIIMDRYDDRDLDDLLGVDDISEYDSEDSNCEDYYANEYPDEPDDLSELSDEAARDMRMAMGAYDLSDEEERDVDVDYDLDIDVDDSMS